MRESTRKVRKIALSAMFTALGVVILCIGSVFDALDLTMAALASFCVVLAMIELGGREALLIYLATSVLALIIAPQKFIAAEYVLFAGCYPLIKSLAERLKLLLSWVVKLIFANISLTLLIIAGKLLFSLPIESGWVIAATYLLVNVTVVIFDIALTRLITFYYMHLRPRFASLFKGIK